MDKILYLEDDIKYAKRLKENIKSFDIDVITTVDELKEVEDFSQYKLLLSDLYVNSEVKDELVEAINDINIPVAIISSTDKVEDELLVFNANIKEFISKSSLFDVVEYRIRSIIDKESVNNLTFMNKGTRFYLIDESKIVTDKAYNVKMLSNREYRILKYLISHSGEPVTREDIYWELYEKKLIASEKRVVDVYINMIRGKLDLDQIKSVRGIGYRWEDEEVNK